MAVITIMSQMEQIWVVSYGWSHEQFTIAMAFQQKTDAIEFIEERKTHHDHPEKWTQNPPQDDQIWWHNRMDNIVADRVKLEKA